MWSPFGHVAQQYLRSCLNVHPTTVIQIEFFRFQQDLSVTDNALRIFIAAQNHIAKILNSKRTDFGLKISSFQYPSLTMKKNVFRIINLLQ